MFIKQQAYFSEVGRTQTKVKTKIKHRQRIILRNILILFYRREFCKTKTKIAEINQFLPQKKKTNTKHV